MANPQENYYSNPAFCQQSEFYSSQQRCKSPPRAINSTKATSPPRANVRQSPVGAQTKMRVLDTSVSSINDYPQNTAKYSAKEDYEEQEFYEEMVVDDSGFVKQKKFVIVSSPQERNGNLQQRYPQNNRYEYIEDSHAGSRYGTLSIEPKQKQIKNRYEYIAMQPQEELTNRGHRYEVIPNDIDVNMNSGRYALVPVEEVPNKNRYAVITQNDIKHRYEYIPEQAPSQQPSRRISEQPSTQEIRRVISPQPQRRGNPVATQKLHELLTTPKKALPIPNPQTPQRVMSPYSPRRNTTPIHRDVFVTPTNTPPKLVRQNSKAQQKLNYALGTRQIHQDKRHTAVIAPICSSPVQSVYSETTFSQKSESWMNLSVTKPPLQITLAVAAVMMILCGGVSSGLCFYMIAIMGRQYFLDFGVVAASTCLLLGLLGLRTRRCYWLPNRNYISGYIVLSVFSLLTCAGLLVLLFMQPKPGTPLADITSGAVCGISVLSLFLASVGVISSYCCKYPPPDNRVQHCARGFTV